MLVVYWSLKPLLGETYLLHSGAHISSPWFACILVVYCSLCASWPLGSWLLEYIYALLSLGPFIFGMRGILSPILGPSMDPGVKLGGITTPYYAHRFGSSHIPPSTPCVEDVDSLLSVFTLVFTLMGVVVDA